MTYGIPNVSAPPQGRSRIRGPTSDWSAVIDERGGLGACGERPASAGTT